MSNSTEFLTTNDEKKNHNSKVNDWWIPYLSSVNRKWKWTGWRFPSRPIVSDSITLIISYFLYHLGISGDQRTVSIRGTSFHADCLCWKSICIEMLVFLLQCYLTIQSISIKRHGFLLWLLRVCECNFNIFLLELLFPVRYDVFTAFLF